MFYTEEINKIALGLNYDKRIQSIDLIETQEFVMSKELIIEKEEMKCNNNPNWLQICDHP